MVGTVSRLISMYWLELCLVCHQYSHHLHLLNPASKHTSSTLSSPESEIVMGRGGGGGGVTTTNLCLVFVYVGFALCLCMD